MTARSSAARDSIVKRAACDLPDGAVVNIGLGMPLLIPPFIPSDREILLHTENGAIGLGPVHLGPDPDPDVTNAGKQYATLVPGAAIFDSCMSFGIVRGGHLDIAILGGMQVDVAGSLANWHAPGRTPGVGGAMDLVSGVREVWILMDHLDKFGKSKMMSECTLPLTGRACVTRVYTELGTFIPTGSAFRIGELAPGVSDEQVRASTEAPIEMP